MVKGLLSPRGSQIATTTVAGTSNAMIRRESDACLFWSSSSSLIARACHGLSWDTPAGYNLSKVVPAVIGRWEFVNVRL